MPFTVEFVEYDGWTKAIITGRLDSPEAFLSSFRAIIRSLLTSGVRRVLVDNRGVSMSIDVLDVTQVAQQLMEDGMTAFGIRFAGVFTEPMAEAFRFLETTLRNNSFWGRIFTDEAEALAWLTS